MADAAGVDAASSVPDLLRQSAVPDSDSAERAQTQTRPSAPVETAASTLHPDPAESTASSAGLWAAEPNAGGALLSPPASSPHQHQLSRSSTALNPAEKKHEDPVEAWSGLFAELAPIYFDDEPEDCAELREAVFAFDELKPAQQQEAPGPDAEPTGMIGPFPRQDVYFEWDRLKTHKRQIVEAIGCIFKKRLTGSSSSDKLGYGKAQFGGYGAVREVAFVPASMHATPEQISTLLGPKHWNLELPDLKVSFDFGAKHPSSLMTQKHYSHTAFTEWYLAAEAKALASAKGKGNEKLRRELRNTQMDKLLEDRISTITQEVLSASFMSANWAFLDRRTATSSSATGELLMESVVGKLGAKKPPVIVMDTLTRWAAFKPSIEVIKSLLVFGDMAAGMETEAPPKTRAPKVLYKPQDFGRWQPYHFCDEGKLREKGDDADTEKLIEEGDRSLPRRPEAVVVKQDEDGSPMKTKDGRPLVTPELKWMYHYRQYLYMGGSHYILFEDALSSTLEFDPPTAYIYGHGSNMAFDRLHSSMSSGVPTVLLHYSGGTTQAFASLFQIVTGGGGEGRRDLKAMLELLDGDIVADEPWTRRLGPNIVEEFVRLEQRAPCAFRRSVAVVDVLQDSAEDVIEKVTGCFAMGIGGLPELGVGDAEDDIVSQTWHTAVVFHYNAASLRFRGDVLFYMATLIALASIVFITLDSRYRLEMSQMQADATNYALVSLPVAATFVGALLSHRRYLQKWSVLHHASLCIVGEIYKFRTAAGEYDISAASSAATAKDGNADEVKAGAAAGPAGGKSPRDIFTERVQQIYSFAILQIGHDSIRYPSKFGQAVAPVNSKKRQTFFRQVEHFVKNVLLRGSHLRTRKRCCRKQRVGPAYDGRLDASHFVGDVDPQTLADDFRGEMSIESYLEFRLQPLLTASRAHAPSLARRLSIFELLGILANVASTLLVVLNNGDYKHFLAVTVSFATALSGISQHQMLQQRLAANSILVQELTKQRSKMSSVSVVLRRSRRFKNMCVEGVENACLSALSAYTGISISLDEDEDDSEDRKDKKDK